MKYRVYDIESKTMYPVCSIDLEEQVAIYKKNGIKKKASLCSDLVMQSIYELDKNGVEIFDGDIVSATYCHNYYGNTRESMKNILVDTHISTSIDDDCGGGPDGSDWYEDIVVVGHKFQGV